jgi:hypothetical protein
MNGIFLEAVSEGTATTAQGDSVKIKLSAINRNNATVVLQSIDILINGAAGNFLAPFESLSCEPSFFDNTRFLLLNNRGRVWNLAPSSKNIYRCGYRREFPSRGVFVPLVAVDSIGSATLHILP